MATNLLLETAVIKELSKVANNEASLAVEDDVEYLYDTLAPTVFVKKDAGEAWQLLVDTTLNQVNDLITPKSVPNEIGAGYRKVTYSTDEYALRMQVTKKDIELYGSATTLTQQATQTVSYALRGNMELRFFNKFLNKDAKWKVKLSGQTAASDVKNGKISFWDDAAATILEDIDAMKEVNGQYAGNTKLNRILMSKDVWNAIKRNPEVYSQMQADASAPKTNSALKEAFAVLTEVERVDVIDYWAGVNLEHIRRVDEVITATEEELNEIQYKRPLKGLFMLYRYENARTLANKAAWNIIDVPKNMVSFNRGIPRMRIYNYHDEGSMSFWVEGRIGAGLHLSNPAGAVFVENVVQDK